MEPFDIRGFIEAASEQLLFLTGIVVGFVTALGQFGVSGKTQLGVAVGIGAFIGGFYFIGSWGLPNSVGMALAMFVMVAVVALVPIGAYELIFKPLRDSRNG